MDFMKYIPRYTTTYCKYGEERMKPTDLFTNHPNPQFKPPCKMVIHVMWLRQEAVEQAHKG